MFSFTIADDAAIGLDNVKKLREGLNYHPMLDEMLERGVKLDNVTFSTNCASKQTENNKIQVCRQ
jgi:glutamate-1-semialdehyde aminotransferase